MQKQYTYVPCNIWISHTTGDMTHAAAWKIFQHDFRNENILPHSCYPYPGKLWKLRWSNFRDGMYSSQDELDCTTMANNPQISIYFHSSTVIQVTLQGICPQWWLRVKAKEGSYRHMAAISWTWGLSLDEERKLGELSLSFSVFTLWHGFLSQLTCWDKPHHYIQSQGPCSLHFISI